MAHQNSGSRNERFSFLKVGDWSAQLIVLGLFLGLLILVGGSSRYDVPQLALLRPISVCVLGYALATMSVDALRAHWSAIALFACVCALTAGHLVPLPPGVWRALPGREILVDIDAVAGLEGVWRPLTMFPEGTWNALYSLIMPLATMLLATQLSQRDLVRLLVWVALLSAATGVIGVMQAAGTGPHFYNSIGAGTSGVFANRNHQAAMLACMFPILGALAMLAPHFGASARTIRIVVAAGAVALIPLILVTGSRMGLVVAVLAFLYTGIVGLWQPITIKRRAHHSLAIFGAGLAAATAMVFATIYTARDVAISRVGAEGEDLRWKFWEAIIEFAPQYLPWGSGIGSFVPVYQIHEPSDVLLPQYINQAHNDWLDVLLTAGIPGVIIMLIAIAMLARLTGTAIVATGTAGHIRRAGVGVILVLAFASLSDYPLRTPLLAALLALAIIWARAPLRLSDNKERYASNASA